MKLRYALIFACMFAATPVRAELVMELSTPKTHYIQHEPFWVVLTFRNMGTQDDKLVRNFDPSLDDMAFDITPPDGRRYRYDSIMEPSGIRYDYPAATVCLGPGERFTADVDLTWEMRLLDEKKRHAVLADVLSRPGVHRIQATYEMPGGNPITLESNECRFTVDEPQGIDRQAYELLKRVPCWSKDTIWFANSESYELRQETYKRVLRAYPKSAYAPHLRSHLAGYYNRLSYEWPEESQRSEWARRSAELYAAAARALADSPAGVAAFGWAVKNYRRGQDRTRCQRTFEAELVAPGMTDDRRLWRLRYLYTELDGWMRPLNNPEDVRVPLRPIAGAMGFSVAWNPEDKTVEVSNARVHLVLRPGENSMTVNGVDKTGVVTSIKRGQTIVSLSVLAPLVADRYGRCREAGEQY